MNTLIQLKSATKVFLVALACFGLSPPHSQSARHPMEAIPEGTPRRGETPFFVSPPAHTTPQLGCFHF